MQKSARIREVIYEKKDDDADDHVDNDNRDNNDFKRERSEWVSECEKRKSSLRLSLCCLD